MKVVGCPGRESKTSKTGREKQDATCGSARFVAREREILMMHVVEEKARVLSLFTTHTRHTPTTASRHI